jgi:hypothetical protein
MKYIKFIPVALFAITLSAYAQDASVNIATQTGNTLGLTISGYQYKEPSLDVKIDATAGRY